MISQEYKDWISDFEYETEKSVNILNAKVDLSERYEKLKFCLEVNDKECYVMMRDLDSARELALENLIMYDQDVWGRDEEYAKEKAEDQWCRILTGEDFGCEKTSNGHIYWEEI